MTTDASGGQAGTAAAQPGWEPAGSIFDEHRPPPADVLDDCVHCGFCLASCPTYLLEGLETNSPRGRIDLLNLGSQGRVELDEEFVANFDACLGCMACVTACPSGVRYDQLIETARPQIERHWRRTPADRAFRGLVFALFPHPGRLRPLAVLGIAYQRLAAPLVRRSGLLDRLPARLRALEALLPSTRLRDLVRRQPPLVPAAGERRARVGLLTGCVQRVFFSDVNAAAARVLAAEGCDVVAPAGQGCCGALSGHAGREGEAMARARATIDAFEEAGDLDAVVVAVAGCGSAMKEYGHLLAEDPAYAERAAAFSARVRDLTEVLVELEPRAPRHPIEADVAYHDACHLRHAQGVTEPPRAVLSAIPRLRVLEIEESEVCCGSAGIYNLVEPEAAERLGLRKAGHVLEVHPDAVATANAGCLLQLRRYLDAGVPLYHPAELLDASIRGVQPPGLPHRSES